MMHGPINIRSMCIYISDRKMKVKRLKDGKFIKYRYTYNIYRWYCADYEYATGSN